MTIRMQQRRATTQEWADANPVLASGELGVETSTGKIKVGDGSSTWSELQYNTISEYQESSVWAVDTSATTSGKLYFDNDTAFFKLGDGVSTWSNLDYFKPASAILGDAGIDFDTLAEIQALLLGGTANQVFVTPDPDGTPVWSSTLTNIQSLDFDTSAGTSGIAKIAYNDTSGTLEFALKDGNITLPIGQQQVIRVKNGTGASLAAGNVVYISGSSGTNFEVSKALATGDSTSAQTLGILGETLSTSGSHGYVTTFGVVKDIDISYISGLTEGDILYLDPTTAGRMTRVKPSAPNHMVYVGYCLSANGGGSNATVFVKPQNGYELDEIHDVKLTSLANNDILTYDNTTDPTKPVWVNKNSVSVTGTVQAGNLTATGSGTTTTPNLRVTNGSAATIASPTGFLIGTTSTFGLLVDPDSIQAAQSSAASALYINPEGGNVNIGSASATTDILGTIANGNTIAAGTATAGTAPLKFTSGTNLTVAEAGAVEYDGNAIYATTNSSHGRGALASILFASGVNASPANSNAAQNWFPTANDALTVSSGTTYLIEAVLNIATTGATSNSLGISILGGGNATIASCTYSAITTNGTAATTNASSTTYVNSAANTTVTAAVAAATNRTIVLKGILRVTTSGTIIPTFTYSAAPGAVPTLNANNFICLTPIGNATVASIGAWA